VACFGGYAAFLEREDFGRDGTFAPERRAFDNPIAIACFRFLCSPFFKWRISVSTDFCAFGPYFRPLDLERDLPRDDDEDERLLRDDELRDDDRREEEDFFEVAAMDCSVMLGVVGC